MTSQQLNRIGAFPAPAEDGSPQGRVSVAVYRIDGCARCEECVAYRGSLVACGKVQRGPAVIIRPAWGNASSKDSVHSREVAGEDRVVQLGPPVLIDARARLTLGLLTGQSPYLTINLGAA